MEKHVRAGQATDYDTIRRMPLTWITKVTDTHSEYVILFALARHLWLRERAWVLRLYVRRPSCSERR